MHAAYWREDKVHAHIGPTLERASLLDPEYKNAGGKTKHPSYCKLLIY